jgi:hypothetical protein
LPTCRDPGILPSHPLWREVRIVMGQRCPAHEPTRVFDANRDLTVMQHASVQTPRSIGNCAIETLGLNHLSCLQFLFLSPRSMHRTELIMEVKAPIKATEVECCGVPLTCNQHRVTCTNCGAQYDQGGRHVAQRYQWGGDHWTDWSEPDKGHSSQDLG